MTVYALAELSIHDRARYARYASRFAEVLAAYGGRLLVADESPAVLAGSWERDKVVLLAFDDERALRAWSESEEYARISADRLASSDGPVLLLHGVDGRAEKPRYDAIGRGYSQKRREDPRIAERIRAALGNARSVVNVGAGAGSYEPADLHVVAIEPSAVMAAQRPPHKAPAIRASADALPMADGSVDAAMAVLSLHHWDGARERGVREMRRVARGPVAILTYDPRVSGAMWLMRDYVPEIAALDHRIFPLPEQITGWMGGATSVEVVPIARDTPDGMLGSFWAHPERVLDPDARAATSGFARMPKDVIERVVSRLERDLADGTWERRNGALRAMNDYDAGLRLIVAMQ